MTMQKVEEVLRRYGYETRICKTHEDARAYMQEHIVHKTVGFGDSQTLKTMGLFESLEPRNTVYDPQQASDHDSFLATAKQALTAEVFITSVNAMATTGEMVNIDGTGNRIAGSLFGHEKVYFVVGSNKIMPDLEGAMWRAKHVAAPRNAKRIGVRTPCALKGDRCYDCSSPERICNGTLIYQRKMADSKMEIILIEETLGI